MEYIIIMTLSIVTLGIRRMSNIDITNIARPETTQNRIT
jgi:hypothetical protein